MMQRKHENEMEFIKRLHHEELAVKENEFNKKKSDDNRRYNQLSELKKDQCTEFEQRISELCLQ